MKSLTICFWIIFIFSSISCEKSSALRFDVEISEVDKENGTINLTSQLINTTDKNLQIFKPIKGFTVNDRIRKNDGEVFSYRKSITPAFKPEFYLILKPEESYSWSYSINEQTMGIPEVGNEPFKFEESETYDIQLYYWMSEYLHPSNRNVELESQAYFFEGNVESNVIRLEY